MKQSKQLNNIKASRLLFWTAWLVYASAYVGRLNFSAALVNIINQDVFTKSQAGLIGTIFFFCYGGGQLINGIVADKLSPFKLIFTGISLSAIANFLMFVSRSYVVMAVIWGFNGIAQSMLWASILFIISNVIHVDMRYKACLYIASSIPTGTLTAYIIAIISSRFQWYTVFGMSAVVLAIAAVIWWIVSSKVIKLLEFTEVSISDTKNKSFANENLGKLIVISGVVIVMFAVMLHGMLKEGIMTWVPTMITETYNVTPTFSIFVSMILPIINLGGAYITTFIFDKVTKKNEIITSVYIMAFTVLPLTVLLFIGKIPLLISVIMLSLITMMMHAFNHVYITLVPLRFKQYNRTATITGIFNSITYAGCAISNYGFGLLSDIFGWRNTVFFWIGVAVIAVIFCVVTIKRWNKFIGS